MVAATLQWLPLPTSVLIYSLSCILSGSGSQDKAPLNLGLFVTHHLISFSSYNFVPCRRLSAYCTMQAARPRLTGETCTRPWNSVGMEARFEPISLWLLDFGTGILDVLSSLTSRAPTSFCHHAGVRAGQGPATPDSFQQ